MAAAARSAFMAVIARFAPAARRPRRFHGERHHPGVRMLRRARCHAYLTTRQQRTGRPAAT